MTQYDHSPDDTPRTIRYSVRESDYPAGETSYSVTRIDVIGMGRYVASYPTRKQADAVAAVLRAFADTERY